MKIIHLNDALEQMNKPVPFNITFVTCDQERKKGGEIIKLDNVILSFNENHLEKLGYNAPAKNTTEFSKSPRHYEHATRNLLLQNGLKKKVHIRLILEFNGQKVFY